MRPHRLRIRQFLRRPRIHLPDTVRGAVFGSAWTASSVIVLLLGIVTDQRSLIVLALLALVSVGLAWLWSAVALRALPVTMDLARGRALLDDEVTLTITLVNRKPIPVPWLTAELELGSQLVVTSHVSTPSGVSGRQIARFSTSLGPFERLTWRVTWRCARRGLHPIGPLTLRAGDVFGFFSDRGSIPGPAPLLVYPRVTLLPGLITARDLLGETRVVRQLTTDPTRIAGVREYRPSDPFRAIHWKATARTGQLQVRVEEPTASLRVLVLLNLDTFEHYWEGLDIHLSEQAITTAASVITWAEKAGMAFGIAANGLLAGTDRPLVVPPASGAAHTARCLAGLARVSPFSTIAFSRLLRAEGGNLPRGGTAVVIASRLPEGATLTLAELLASGRRVILIPLNGCEVPPLPGLIVRHIATPPEPDRPRPGTDAENHGGGKVLSA